MLDFADAHPTYKSLDDRGVRALKAAIIIQAARDLYDSADWIDAGIGKIYELVDFIYSDWFSSLTQISPKDFIKTISDIRKSGKRFPSISQTMKEPETVCNDYYESTYLDNLLEDTRFAANSMTDKGVELTEWGRSSKKWGKRPHDFSRGPSMRMICYISNERRRYGNRKLI